MIGAITRKQLAEPSINRRNGQDSGDATQSLIEVHTVARRLSVSDEFVRRLLRSRKLKAVRLGGRWRVDPHDLEAFIDTQRK